ncbi:Protein sym-1 [Colletotrichum orbiculare MAFF 240422]|uniref:Protein sym-1 n=1 Tax=Colletotrichum orbiculare (strain 104-T / ATCC 96160 / CBS 514.97 / LARS 414 / MAFF 240422) TaxID=1213857 RepID=A0A484FQY9_COLOR|nr:Protein sym-1 [Colletotrichum orbiculare MAFF 240422]
MLGWYQARLAARPLLTQSITTSILFATGDITAQQLVDKRGLKGHDWSRTGRMALYGGTIFGPAATTWFKFLQKNIVLRNKNLEILARVGVDQGVFAPVMIGVFLSSMAVLEGGSPQEKLQKNYTTALTSNFLLWPFVQAVNFKFVPLHHRVLFVNVISIDTYIADEREQALPSVGFAKTDVEAWWTFDSVMDGVNCVFQFGMSAATFDLHA